MSFPVLGCLGSYSSLGCKLLRLALSFLTLALWRGLGRHFVDPSSGWLCLDSKKKTMVGKCLRIPSHGCDLPLLRLTVVMWFMAPARPSHCPTPSIPFSRLWCHWVHPHLRRYHPHRLSRKSSPGKIGVFSPVHLVIDHIFLLVGAHRYWCYTSGCDPSFFILRFKLSQPCLSGSWVGAYGPWTCPLLLALGMCFFLGP